MLTNLKRILLTQYIGAIITAYLGVQAILGVIQIAVYVVMWFVEGKQVGVFGGMSRPRWIGRGCFPRSFASCLSC